MRKIMSLTRKLIEEQSLIEDGDKIAVGLSGGKDSLALLVALRTFQKFSDKKFELIAISVDLSNGEMDYSAVADFCKQQEVDFHLENSNVFEIVFDIRKEKNPCSLCANMRRGILNTAAKKYGCNKVALAHHSDDLVETFLMSMFFEGRLYVMQPKSYLSRTDLTVIRPFLLVEENDIKNATKNMPIIHNVCPKNHFSERENAKKIIEKLNDLYPGCKNKILNALVHPERYNLWK